MASQLVPAIPASVLEAVPNLIRFPTNHFSVDYDREADVLYISFTQPQQATESEMSDEGILLRYRGDQLVGLTILNASRRT